MKKGFTLIELLIVIAIISILIGIALPRFRSMQDEGNIAKAKGELSTLQTAVESYYLHNNNTYPVAGGTWQGVLTGSTPQVISSALTDPFNGATQYGYVVNNTTYAIYSVGVGATGSVTAVNSTNVTEANGTACIYVSNVARDTQP